MDDRSEALRQIVDWLNEAWMIARDWAVAPAAWSQLALLVIAYLAARLAARRLQPPLARFLTPKEGARGPIAALRRFALRFPPLLLPLLAYGLTAAGEGVTRAAFGSGDLIAFGKRLFIFIAARIFVREVLREGFLFVLGRYVLVPVAALHALGVLDDVLEWLDSTQVSLGTINFSALALVRGAIAGAVLYWLGGWSNRHSADYIKARAELRPAQRELASKAAEIAIYGLAFLLLMSIMGIDLTALAVVGGAVGVGVGFGLQTIASNYAAGVILLLEGQTTVGDYVELDDGSAGTIVRMTARACILETFDGKWIVVPNEHFITSRVRNYSDSGSANRYEAPFAVSHDTDINRVPDLIEAAVAELPFVLDKPQPPQCELDAFGPLGVEFRVKYWVNGLDDGGNDYGTPVKFAIWNALKGAGIAMPPPGLVLAPADGAARHDPAG